MKIAFYYIFLYIFLLSLQISFLDVLFPNFLVPIVILVAGVIWTIRLGFKQALWRLVPLLIFYELLVSGELRLFVIYGVILAYATSFLSRRMLIEESVLAVVFYSFCIIVGALVFQVGTQLLLQMPVTGISWQSFIIQYGVTVVLFWVTKKIIFFFQDRIDTYRSDRALMIR
jgi:hypothetical protein